MEQAEFFVENGGGWADDGVTGSGSPALPVGRADFAFWQYSATAADAPPGYIPRRTHPSGVLTNSKVGQ